MPFLTPLEAFQRFKNHGRNSSHFVWNLGDFKFFESSNGWVFGYQQIGDVTLLALEPIIPQVRPIRSPAQSNEDQFSFDVAWNEFSHTVQPKISAFIGIYGEFLKVLHPAGFQSIQVGQEPWVDLTDCIPTGNSGKGVRSARNQAIYAGVVVEEWTAQQINDSTSKKHELHEIFSEWKNARLINLDGFLNSTDPFVYMETRRYFVAKSQNGSAQAFLVATPIPDSQSWFIEDMAIRAGAPRGAGELLTLEALVALRDSGACLASLGVVSATTVDVQSAHSLPDAVRFFMLKVPKYLRSLYNFDGLEVFRKRFKPIFWEQIHIAVKNNRSSGVSDTWAWFKVLFAVLLAFRPRLQFKAQWFLETFIYPMKRYPMTAIISLGSLALFAGVNHFGELPQSALIGFGFSGDVPLSQWFYRSVVSDYLYWNASHFLIWGSLFFMVLKWAEKTHKRNFIVPFVIGVSVFDDFINYALVTHPLQYFQPGVFRSLVAFKDVGGSLIMITLFGLQLCQLKKNREILFAAVAVCSVFGFVFNSAHLHSLVLNLNHFLFLCLGYIGGKIKVEYDRKQSRLTSKKKPPVAKSVATRKAA